MELIANPPMLFLDEPTSGLDTFTAFTVVKSLKRLAKQGRTVIATIHQPGSEIFHLFDDLIILSEGHIIYCGDAAASIDYFARLGYPCPRYSNPADFYFMEILRQFNVPGYQPQSIMIEPGTLNFDEPEDDQADQTEQTVQTDQTDQTDQVKQQVGQATNTDEQQVNHDQNDPNNDDQLSEVDSTKERIESLHRAWQESPENTALHKDMEASSREGVAVGTLRKQAPFWTQFKFLLQRASKNAIRNPLIVFLAAFRAIFLGLLVGLLFLDSNRYNVNVQIRNKSGAIFFLALNTFFSSCFGVLTIFYTEKQVFFREYKAGYYRTTPYFLSKFLVELPYAFLFPYLMVLIAYYLVGLNPPFSDYLLAATFVAVASICGVALGVLLASIFDDLQVILAITPAILLPLLLLSGIFVSASSVPGFLIWIRYISPIYYSTIGMLQIEFSRPFPNCHPPETCDGNFAFQVLDTPKPLPIGVNLALDFTLWAALTIISYLVLATLTKIRYASS